MIYLLLAARMSAQPGGGGGGDSGDGPGDGPDGDGPGGDGNDKRCQFNMTQRAFHSHRTLEDILLSTDYDASSRPEVARERDLKNKPTAVTWTLATKGFSISEKANTVTLTGEVTESWVDERLAFNYTQGDTCPSDSPPVWTVSKSHYYQIWRPWLYISNQVSTSDISNAGSSLKVSDNGAVTWTYNTLITARCALDLKRSPFDTQTCGVDVMSLSYDACADARKSTRRSFGRPSRRWRDSRLLSAQVRDGDHRRRICHTKHPGVEDARGCERVVEQCGQGGS